SAGHGDRSEVAFRVVKKRRSDKRECGERTGFAGSGGGATGPRAACFRGSELRFAPIHAFRVQGRFAAFPLRPTETRLLAAAAMLSAMATCRRFRFGRRAATEAAHSDSSRFQVPSSLLKNQHPWNLRIET